MLSLSRLSPGRVFLITEGGDLKPARLASVYLLWEQRTRYYADLTEEEKKVVDYSALVAWRVAELKAVEEIGRIAMLAHYHSTTAECLEEVQAYSTAFEDLLKWGTDPKNTNQLLLADADEEGSFTIKVPRPGMYTLLAHGRAGFYKAFWEDRITVESGKDTIVKLASPKKACIVSAVP